jgi:UDP-N-acetylmuramate--alanine ligase
MNAAMAVAAAVAAGADVKQAAQAVGDFRGVDRRQSHLGTVAGCDVVDDYAHHPTEIRATLAALRDRYLPSGHGRLVCIFQPHQASRTRHLLADFATSFTAADLLFVPDIYSVRDTADDRRFVTSDTLAARVRDAGGHAEHVPDFAAVADRVRGELRPGDVVVTMGAGDVWRVGRMLLDAPTPTREAA